MNKRYFGNNLEIMRKVDTEVNCNHKSTCSEIKQARCKQDEKCFSFLSPLLCNRATSSW